MCCLTDTIKRMGKSDSFFQRLNASILQLFDTSARHVCDASTLAAIPASAQLQRVEAPTNWKPLNPENHRLGRANREMRSMAGKVSEGKKLNWKIMIKFNQCYSLSRPGGLSNCCLAHQVLVIFSLSGRDDRSASRVLPAVSFPVGDL